MNDDTRPPPPRRYRAIAVLERPFTQVAGITCRDFARLSVARLDRPLTKREQMQYRFHDFICRLCREFSGQFELINELIRETAQEPGSEEGDAESLRRIEAGVRERVGRE
jgi:hypothetical protein